MAHTDTQPKPEVDAVVVKVTREYLDLRRQWIVDDLRMIAEKIVTLRLACDRAGDAEELSDAGADARRCVEQAIDHLSNT